MYDRKIILVGYSGHAFVVVETALDNQLNIIGYAEKKMSVDNFFKLDYLGCETDGDFKGWEIDADFLIGIGDNLVRKKIFELLTEKGKKVITLKSPSASISKYAVIGNGVFISRNVAINAFARIGDNVILNTNCIIEHECIIDNNVHIAPGAVLAGSVQVGEGAFIGANAVVKQGISIGKNVIVGAGAVVINDIPDEKKVVGNPIRFI